MSAVVVSGVVLDAVKLGELTDDTAAVSAGIGALSSSPPQPAPNSAVVSRTQNKGDFVTGLINAPNIKVINYSDTQSLQILSIYL